MPSLVNLDINVVDYLKGIHISEPGLFNNDSKSIIQQLEFLYIILSKIKDMKYVLEIGTNKGFFDYFVVECFPSVHIDTVDMLIESEQAIQFIKRMKGADINFYHSLSKDFFNIFKPNYKIDFAWVDGGHNADICLNDLIGCAELNIPIICLDDYRTNFGVIKGLCEFMRITNKYIITGMSSTSEDRGILCLEKNYGTRT
jgi:hypothetical protein